MYQFLANAYVATLPFVFAFTLADGRFSPTMLVSLAMALMLWADTKPWVPWSREVRSVLLTGVPLFLYVVVGPLLTDSFGTKSLTHYLAYGTSVVFFFIVPALFIARNSNRISADGVLRALTVALLVSSAYAVGQFLCRNAFDLNIEEYLRFPGGIEADSTFLGLYYRARGFAPEPGHFALYLETCIPLMTLYFSRSGSSHHALVKLFCFSLVALAVLATASPVPLFLLSSVFFFVALTIRPRMSALGWVGIFALVAIAVTGGYVLDMELRGGISIRDLAWQFAFDKVSSSSAEDRVSRLQTVGDIISSADLIGLVFGGGAAISDKLGLGAYQTILSLYPLIFAEIGIVGILLFAYMFFSFANSARGLPGLGRRYWWWGVLTILLHYTVVANYWYPYLWIFGVVPYLFRENADERT